MKKIAVCSFFILFLLVNLACSAWAIPHLQIYIPGASYDERTETWVINSYDYDLWVIGANVNIYDVKFAAAVPKNEDGKINVTWDYGKLVDKDDVLKEPDFSETLFESTPFTDKPVNLSNGDPTVSFTPDGIPLMGDGSEVPRGGVFPTSYYEYFIGDFGTGQTVQNYIPGDEWGDQAKGETKKFHISVSDYSWVDIVAYDHYIKSENRGKSKKDQNHYIFSPFSHDGGSQVPVPAPILLLGSGIAGLIAVHKRRTGN